MTEVRLRYCWKRCRFEVPDTAREAAIRAVVRALTRAACDLERAERLLEDAASASPEQLRALVKYVEAETGAGLPSGEPEEPSSHSRWRTGRRRHGWPTARGAVPA